MARSAAVLIVLVALAPLGLALLPAGPPVPRPAALASNDLPTWLVGDKWAYETHAVTRDGPNWTDAWNNLTFTVAQRIEAVQDGAYLYLYNSSTAGDLSAQGDMAVPGFGTVHYTIASNSVRGYVWNERGDLALARTNQTFAGSGFATLPFGTYPLAAAGNVTIVNRPPEEDFDFPVELGDTWRLTSMLNTTGSVRLVVDLPTPIPDFVIVQSLAGDTRIDSRSWVNGSERVTVPAGLFDALRIHSIDAYGPVTDRWYAPNASNTVKLETHNVSGSARYTHAWTNLTSLAPAIPALPVTIELAPRKVGPDGLFTVYANTSAANAAVRVVVPATNLTRGGSTNGTGAFRMVLPAPSDNDHTPANTDTGSHGVLVEIVAATGSGFGGATVSLLRPDLTLTGLTVRPTPVADSTPTNLTTRVSVATDVPVFSPVNVTFVAEDVDLNRDGVMDNPISVYCGRSTCASTAGDPVLPGNPVVATASWTLRPQTLPADVRVSAVVDPMDRYAETNESNNVVVMTVRVEAPNLTPSSVTVDARGTSHVFDNPASLGFVSPLITVPSGAFVNLTATVKNAGVINTSGSTVVAFYNTTGLNGSGDPPFAQFSTGPIDAGVEVGLASVPWTAPVVPGTYFVNITSDYTRMVRETSESDNTFVVRLRVYNATSAPELVPVGVSIPPKASLNRSVTITVRVSNLGPTNATGFLVAFYNASARSTPFAIRSVGPLGTGATSSVLSATWSSGVLGPHGVWIEVDYGDAVPEGDESNNAVPGTITVYDRPITSIHIGSPKIVTNTTYILPATPLSFTSIDRSEEGPPAIWYRVDSGGWRSISSGAAFDLPGGPHTVSYNATDRLGGEEPTRVAAVFVDDLPPDTAMTLSNGTNGMLISFTAEDLACGVNWTEYRVDGGAWTRYSGTAFLITAAGNHTVDFRSVDLLGNREPSKTTEFYVTGSPVLPVSGFNVKPALAAVFAAMLFLLGWFAAPSPDPPRRRRWLFTVVAPPAVVELLTGAVSLGVSEMAVPGGSLGLPVDIALLVLGFLVILLSRRRVLRPAA